MKRSSVIYNAIDLLRSGWCRGDTALSDEGRSVHPGNGRAVRFDVMGAVLRSSDGLDVAKDVVVAIREKTGRGLVDWNDDPATGFDDIVSTLEDVARVFCMAGH